MAIFHPYPPPLSSSDYGRYWRKQSGIRLIVMAAKNVTGKSQAVFKVPSSRDLAFIDKNWNFYHIFRVLQRTSLSTNIKVIFFSSIIFYIFFFQSLFLLWIKFDLSGQCAIIVGTINFEFSDWNLITSSRQLFWNSIETRKMLNIVRICRQDYE